MRREIAHPWRCDQRGDCCQRVQHVTMTREERALIEAATDRALTWAHDPDPRFVRLQAAPCPLLVEGQCSVYDARPFNCRRFICGRVGDEPWESANDVCLNLTDRLAQSLDFQEFYRSNQKRAQVWARAHGWTA